MSEPAEAYTAAQKAFARARDLHRQGKIAEAEPLYRAALAEDAGYDAAMEWLGVLCLQGGRMDEAIRLLDMATQAAPENATYQDNLAAALMRAGRLEEAVEACRRSIVAAPKAYESRALLGTLLYRLGKRNTAMEFFDQAIHMDPHLQAVCRDTTKQPMQEACNRTIVENCRHILARYPQYAPGYFSLAEAYLNLGQIPEARRAAEQAIAVNPTVPAYYHVLIFTGDAARNAPAVSALQQLAAQEEELPAEGRIFLHFLLAKAYEDLNRYEEAFAHLQQANALKRATFDYDVADDIARMEAIAAAFPAERLPPASPSEGYPSDVPVFVVGMLRSGTTLVEQILSSHPSVCGVGELPTIDDFVKAGRAGAAFPQDCAALEPSAWRRFGEDYVARIAALTHGERRVIDKLPLNFLYLGVLRKALPQARIIHVKRDPVDTCFSCFALMFAGDTKYAYDLADLGRYYQAYARLMAHWRSVLSPDVFLEVQYEDLVADQEGQTRRLLDFCGLPWDARCLEYYKTKRAVVTASQVQVRQPIYKNAVGRAEAFAPWLAPLRAALAG